MMKLNWESFEKACNRLAPPGTPRRKLVQVLSIILLFEGISVLIMFSYDAAAIGVFSIALGVFLLLLFYPGSAERPARAEWRGYSVDANPTPGLKLIDFIERRLGGKYTFLIFGVVVIAAVLIYNQYFSRRSEIGDLDTLSILFGGMIAAYPLVKARMRVEAAFSVIFLGLVVIFLVVPQAVMSISSEAGTSVGNSYVHYMLAAPFAGILNVFGISAHTSGNVVFMIFSDGTPSSLTISAYCAGMYSFSIFVAAFFSFVLVFERLPPKLMAAILALGLAIAYLGNLFRMIVIGLVGYYRGMDALLWTHRNVGWMIFLGWSAIFWYLVLGYVSRRTDSRNMVAGPD